MPRGPEETPKVEAQRRHRREIEQKYRSACDRGGALWLPHFLIWPAGGGFTPAAVPPNVLRRNRIATAFPKTVGPGYTADRLPRACRSMPDHLPAPNPGS